MSSTMLSNAFVWVRYRLSLPENANDQEHWHHTLDHYKTPLDVDTNLTSDAPDHSLRL